MRRRKKKEITFLIIFFLCITLTLGFLFQSSYAKYRKQISAETSFDIAQWNIILNDEDITGKTTLENTIQPTYEANEYVNENVIAPGSKGYVDLKINATNVDVTFKYNITATTSENSAIQDLVVYGYVLNPTTTTTEADATAYDGSTTISGTIAPNTERTNIRLYIKWDDSESNTMDNAADTLAATNSENKGIIKATINFTQVN